MIVSSTFIVASLICCASATNLHIKSDASVPNILADASEAPGDGRDLPEEFMRSLHEEQLQCVSALQVGTQLHIQKNESVTGRFEDVDAALWDGMDLPEEELMPLLESLYAAQHFINDSSSSHGHKFGILGPFDSGTHLMQAMMHLNFPIMENSVHHVWKHKIDARVIREKMAKWVQASGENLTDIVLITLVRSPIAQVVSWKHAPYNLKKCMNRPWADMGEPCTAQLDPKRITGFWSTIDVYNTYLQLYRELKASGVFKDVLMIQYEDLVLDPISVMTRIGLNLNITPPDQFKIVIAPAKPDAQPVGRAGALLKLAKRSWMSSVSDGLKTLCKGLNDSLIKGLVEGSYRDLHHQVPYSHDCSGLPMLGGTLE